jgi:hypothetical protein
MPAIEFLEMRSGSAVQTKGLGLRFVLAEIAVDRGLEIDQRMEDAALQAAARERGEERFNRIGPGAGGGREMKRPSRVPGQPGAHFGMLVGGIVVEDRVDELAGRYGGLSLEERKTHIRSAIRLLCELN